MELTLKQEERVLYLHNIKEKVEKLILIFAAMDNIILSSKKRFRIDWDVYMPSSTIVPESNEYKYYRRGKNKDGTRTLITTSFEEWMAESFPEITLCIEVYERLLSGCVFQDDLRALNKLHKKYMK